MEERNWPPRPTPRPPVPSLFSFVPDFAARQELGGLANSMHVFFPWFPSEISLKCPQEWRRKRRRKRRKKEGTWSREGTGAWSGQASEDSPAHREASRRHRGGRQEGPVNGSGGGWNFKGSPSPVLSGPAGPVLAELMTLSSDLSSACYVKATCIKHRQREVVNEEEIALTYSSYRTCRLSYSYGLIT